MYVISPHSLRSVPIRWFKYSMHFKHTAITVCMSDQTFKIAIKMSLQNILQKKKKPSGATISLIIRLHASYPAPLVTFMEGLSLQNRATLGIDNN